MVKSSLPKQNEERLLFQYLKRRFLQNEPNFKMKIQGSFRRGRRSKGNRRGGTRFGQCFANTDSGQNLDVDFGQAAVLLAE
jgi:hypothetical protein